MEKHKKQLENLDNILDKINDPNVRIAINLLFNIIEEQASENQKLREENQKLRDENNILKGEQPKPDIKPNNKGRGGGNISSEKERKGAAGANGKKKRNRTSKKDKIKINITKVCKVDKSSLPADAEFKGYESVIVQDLKISTNNIEFKKEIYYSPSKNKVYRGGLPTGYTGEFGPNVKALAIIMKYVCNTSEPKILEFFNNFNILISASSISRMLTKKENTSIFHKEKKLIFEAGLKSTNYQQIDDTGARVNGKNYVSQVICNELYTAFFTTKKKDRQTVLNVLQNFRKKKYLLGKEALRLLKLQTASKSIINAFTKIYQNNGKEIEYSHEELKKLINFHNIHKRQKSKVLDALGIAYYHKQTKIQVPNILICDDAPQFKLLTKERGLCWVHDGRNYKKLTPIVPRHITAVKEFLNKYWDYYEKLLEYKKNPQKAKMQELSIEFNELFSTVTEYKKLNKRIAKTLSDKKELLLVLKYPNIPLHNNQAELGARAQVRRRDISLQTITAEGTKASDTFLTFVQTAKKLGVNTYDYIFDRVSKKFNLPSLAEIITQRALEIKMAKI
ncbi:transposase [Patescibacteria group bacterium]|nr:transposase [Patescibacteria group bacterium]